MNRTLAALLSGLLFGVGLVVSGMTDPANVMGFLDVTGNFRPALAGVMGGAVLVHALGLRLGSSRSPVARASLTPRKAEIDGALVLGAAVFGVGWGLGGYCPGPGIVSMGQGSASATVFVLASLVGIFGANVFQRGVTASPSSFRVVSTSTNSAAEAK
ncbi:MAG TPA: DUF6691 family protein [Polyangiaceae bacterium]|nr:DUF6691 family protein [Polyangiaceae bacterium]